MSVIIIIHLVDDFLLLRLVGQKYFLPCSSARVDICRWSQVLPDQLCLPSQPWVDQSDLETWQSVLCNQTLIIQNLVSDPHLMNVMKLNESGAETS